MEGMAGRVVSKQGAIIARAFLAEFASGIGDVFEAQGTTTSITGAGVIESIDPNKAFQSGVASGVSEAFSRLGDFYMDLAEQMVPVIEINAGRNVDVVFIKSVDRCSCINYLYGVMGWFRFWRIKKRKKI